MAKYRHVHTSFWTDPDVMEEFTVEDRYFFLYLLTNPLTTQIGIYKITIKQMAFELGYDINVVKSVIKRFENDYKVIKYNAETRELAMKNWGKYNLVKGGKPVEDCVKKELLEVNDKTLIPYIAENIANSKIKGIVLDFYETGQIVFEPSKKAKIENNEEFTTRNTIREQKEKEKEKENNISADSVLENEEFKKVAQAYHDIISPNIGGLINKVDKWLEIFQSEVVILAMEEAAYYNARSWAYVESILNTWHNSNFKSVDDVKKSKQKKESKALKEDNAPGYKSAFDFEGIA